MPAITKTLIRTIAHAVTGSNYTYEIASYHTSKQNVDGNDIYHYIVTYFDPEGEEVIWTLKPKTYRSIARAEHESNALCLEWTANDAENAHPAKDTPSGLYCDRVCHDGEELLHDGEGGHYCEACEENPDSDDE